VLESYGSMSCTVKVSCLNLQLLKSDDSQHHLLRYLAIIAGSNIFILSSYIAFLKKVQKKDKPLKNGFALFEKRYHKNIKA